MLYHMYMDTFSALAEPTRRTIIEMLATRGELSATDIYENFSVSSSAISQHLKVLREAKWIQMEKRAQQRIYQINPDCILELEEWTKKMTHLWNQRFEALDKVLEAEKKRLKNR